MSFEFPKNIPRKKSRLEDVLSALRLKNRQIAEAKAASQQEVEPVKAGVDEGNGELPAYANDNEWVTAPDLGPTVIEVIERHKKAQG